MFRHRLDETVSFKTRLDWLLLCFLAGAVNAGGFLACQRFVSHLTGFATLVGIDIARANWLEALGVLTVPLYFLLGVMVSAQLIDKRRSEGKEPKYEWVMSAITICLFIVMVSGIFGVYGEFGTDLVLSHDYMLLALLCAASGLQNAAVTSTSGATIRTTHLTGLTTDLGIGLVRLGSDLHKGTLREKELRATGLRVGMILFFIAGSAVAGIGFLKFKYAGFALPTGLALYFTLVAFRDKKNERAEANV